MELPKQVFLDISTKVPLINVDMLVLNEMNEVLLSWRDDIFCGTGWHIPGGIIRHGETMKQRLYITAKQELGFIPEFDNQPCKITEIFLEQEYRNHFISHLFIGHCKKNDVKVSNENSHKIGDLMWFSYYPGLVYSQASYEQYLKSLLLSLQQKSTIANLKIGEYE